MADKVIELFPDIPKRKTLEETIEEIEKYLSKLDNEKKQIIEGVIEINKILPKVYALLEETKMKIKINE